MTPRVSSFTTNVTRLPTGVISDSAALLCTAESHWYAACGFPNGSRRFRLWRFLWWFALVVVLCGCLSLVVVGGASWRPVREGRG